MGGSLMGACDNEGPHIPGCKFPCAPTDGDVLCLEPHTLADLVLWCRLPPPVRLLLHPGRCFMQVGVCVALQVRLHRRMKASADWTPTCSSWLGNSGGWYPRQHSKGERLVAAET